MWKFERIDECGSCIVVILGWGVGCWERIFLVEWWFWKYLVWLWSDVGVFKGWKYWV